MPTVETIQVYWKNKASGRLVQINKADFDAALHRLPGDVAPVEVAEPAPVEAPAPKVEPVKAIRKGRK